MSKPKSTITVLDILKAPAGHQRSFCGTGIHRDQRKQPKGGRNGQLRRALRDW